MGVDNSKIFGSHLGGNNSIALSNMSLVKSNAGMRLIPQDQSIVGTKTRLLDASIDSKFRQNDIINTDDEEITLKQDNSLAQ